MKGKNITELAEKYNVTPVAIWSILKRRGVKCRPQTEVQRKYPIIEDFFDTIDTEEKAYWLGFLYADGCLKKDSLCLRIKDKEHIKKFRDTISPKRPIYLIPKKLPRLPNNYYEVALCNKKICLDIGKWFKTRKEKIPNLKKELLHHFIRGFFDGDGSIGIWGCRKEPEFSIWNNSKELCKKIRSIFHSKLGLHIVKLRKKGNCYAIRYKGRNNLKKIYCFLYKKATIFLERKKEKFEQIFL